MSLLYKFAHHGHVATGGASQHMVPTRCTCMRRGGYPCACTRTSSHTAACSPWVAAPCMHACARLQMHTAAAAPRMLAPATVAHNSLPPRALSLPKKCSIENSCGTNQRWHQPEYWGCQAQICTLDSCPTNYRCRAMFSSFFLFLII